MKTMNETLRELDDEALLEKLNEERLPRSRPRNDLLCHAMIKELITRKVYPEATVDHNPNTVFAMVEGYGARWHVWKEPLCCPHCGADLRDHRVGPPFKREIGHTDRGLDRTTHFTCPDCKGTLR
jgi:hypothetical protein